jgi:hypothetical protein
MVLMHGHSRALWVWIGAEMVVLGILVVKSWRLMKKGDCA